MKTFSLDEALSNTPSEVTRIDWVTASLAEVEKIGVYSEDPELAIVTTKGPHGLKAGDDFYLSGFDFQIDGMHEAMDHPHAKVDDPKIFAIQTPKRLGPIALSGGSLHKRQTYGVFHAKHLSLSGTTELKQLQADQAANLQAQLQYQSDSSAVETMRAETIALAKKLKIEYSAKFLEDVLNAAQVAGDERAEAITAIKKTFGLTSKGVNKAIEDLVEKGYTAILSTMEALGSLSEDEVMKAFEERRVGLQKREIEIMCEMPRGLMSALDNLSGAGDLLNQIYAHIGKALSPPASDKEPEEEGNA